MGLLLLLGVVLFSGTGGTFSSFNAETTNVGSAIAAGTLTMTNQVTGQQACFSASGNVGSPSGNVNPDCSAILNLTNIEPGAWSPATAEGSVTVTNSGTLNANNLTLFAPSATDCTDSQTAAGSALNFNSAPAVVTLTSTLPSGTAVTSLSLSSIPQPITYGDTLVVTNASSGKSQTFTAAGTYAPNGGTGSTSVLVDSSTASTNFGTTSTVDDLSQWPTYVSTSAFPTTTQAIADGATVSSITVSSLPGAVVAGDSLAVTNAAGQEETFTVASTSYAAGSNPVAIGVLSTTAGYSFPIGSTVEDVTAWRPLCSNLVLYVQEQAKVNGNTDYYCWYGPGAVGSGGSEQATDGLCDTPLVLTGTAVTASSSVSSLTFAQLPVALPAASYVTLTNASGQSENFQVTAQVGPSTSPTSVTVASTTASYDFPTGSSGLDTTAQSLTQQTQTLGNFDTSNAENIGGITLYPISGVGTVSQSETALQSLASRTFTVGVYLPAVSGQNQNMLQGLQSSFGMSWYMSQ
ncbi:MAG: hypothetical protein M0004_12545 [Actinomycetota bacterium]|nr:hypothetical protein [Actinomycetota bacterium]